MKDLSIKALVAERVYKGRTKKGWSQGELAEAAGVTQARISEIENGLRDYRINTADKVLSALGLTVRIR